MLRVEHKVQQQRLLTALRRPGVPTTTWGVFSFSCWIFDFIGRPPKKLATFTVGR